MSSDPDLPVVVEEFAELHRSLDVGLAKIDGRLALLSQRDGQIDKDLTDLTVRISTLEHTRWPLPTVAVLAAVGALAVAVWQALGH
ncbi:hypothetical protein [Streptomyces beijiangensis]|uniref:Uncharacterized protein n=1 Tax=Streptomyces beijiangensis TaxID=163361 RepID=A0A939F2J2_9ACTN|nr:hypothetical protein [Streptomyces beijiangensis]MBO0510671.1 hypothetical protein [Streptomyces beijiangensis]